MKRLNKVGTQNNGFTLIELLIVVVILGILAAVIVPQLSGSTDNAKLESLKTNLASIRSAIDLYKQDHGVYPGTNAATGASCPNGGTPGTGAARTKEAFASQLTMYTNAAGQACSTTDSTFKYGPYLKTTKTGTAGLPKNPITGVNTVTFPTTSGDLSLTSSNSAGTGGWLYDEVTGKFIADDNTGTPSYDSY